MAGIVVSQWKNHHPQHASRCVCHRSVCGERGLFQALQRLFRRFLHLLRLPELRLWQYVAELEGNENRGKAGFPPAILHSVGGPGVRRHGGAAVELSKHEGSDGRELLPTDVGRCAAAATGDRVDHVFQ